MCAKCSDIKIRSSNSVSEHMVIFRGLPTVIQASQHEPLENQFTRDQVHVVINMNLIVPKPTKAKRQVMRLPESPRIRPAIAIPKPIAKRTITGIHGQTSARIDASDRSPLRFNLPSRAATTNNTRQAQMPCTLNLGDSCSLAFLYSGPAHAARPLRSYPYLGHERSS